MKRNFLVVVAMGLAVGPLALAQQPAPQPTPAKGFPAVAAMFGKKCAPCHTGDRGGAGGLNVTSYERIMKPSRSGVLIVPGKSAKSLLMEYLKGKNRPLMPKNGKPLTPTELKVVSDWIDAGAKNK